MIRASEFRSVQPVEKAFIVDDIDESFPLMSRNLESGDIPLYLNYNGQQYLGGNISTSPRNVKKLLTVCKVSIKKGTEIIPLSDTNHYMQEVLKWI